MMKRNNLTEIWYPSRFSIRETSYTTMLQKRNFLKLFSEIKKRL